MTSALLLLLLLLYVLLFSPGDCFLRASHASPVTHLTMLYTDVLSQVRRSISAQLQTLTRFHGRILTARQLAVLFTLVAESLNTADGTIFPNSVVDGILTAEAQALRRCVTLDFEQVCRDTSNSGDMQTALASRGGAGGGCTATAVSMPIPRRRRGVCSSTPNRRILFAPFPSLPSWHTPSLCACRRTV